MLLSQSSFRPGFLVLVLLLFWGSGARADSVNARSEGYSKRRAARAAGVCLSPSATQKSPPVTPAPSSSSVKVANPLSATDVFSSNCQMCTLVERKTTVLESCTTIAGCTPTSNPIKSVPLPIYPAPSPQATFVVYLSNNSVPVGDADNANNGADLRNNMFQKTQALCPDNTNECTSTSAASFDDIPTVVGGGEEFEKLSFTISDSHYENTQARDKMLAYSITTWEQATRKTCQEVEFTEDADETATGCGSSPVRRDIPHAKLTRTSNSTHSDWNSTPIEKRDPSPLCDGCTPPTFKCHYKATICAGPDHISTVLRDSKGDPYGNHMNIAVAWKLDGSAFNAFVCELVLDGLSALVDAVAPELLEYEIVQEVEWQALCEDVAQQINPRSLNMLPANVTLIPS